MNKSKFDSESSISREEYARYRKSETRTELQVAMNALEHGYWSKCLRHIAEAKKSAAKWEHAEDVWRDWPNDLAQAAPTTNSTDANDAKS